MLEDLKRCSMAARQLDRASVLQPRKHELGHVRLDLHPSVRAAQISRRFSEWRRAWLLGPGAALHNKSSPSSSFTRQRASGPYTYVRGRSHYCGPVQTSS